MRGAMTLIDEERSAFLYRRLGPAREVSGGSCANTIAGVASLGGRAAYIGRVRDDQLGGVFSHDIRAAGVTFRSRPSAAGPSTATSMIFVTPDGQRTMNTYLGACVELGPDDVDPELVAGASDHLPRGLSLGPPRGQGGLPQGGRRSPIGRQADGADAVRFVLRRPLARASSASWSSSEVDILFANEAELTSLYEVGDFDAALQEVRRHVHFAALTRGRQGLGRGPGRGGPRRSTPSRRRACSTPPAPATSTRRASCAA